MTDTGWFGYHVGVHQVRRAVEDTLKLWLPVALVDTCRQSQWFDDDDDIERWISFPRSWNRLADYRSVRADQVPNVTVGGPQLASRSLRQPSRPGRQGRQGAVDATWDINVAAVVRSDSYERTADLTGVYATAIGLVLEQQVVHHELVSHVEIPAEGSEQYDGAADSEARSLGICICQAQVTIEEARSVRRQASEAPDDPFAPAPDMPPEAIEAIPSVDRRTS